MASQNRNVICFCLDTVRKDYFDRFAPRLREDSDSSYTQCRAASSWTTPSHASMFSGKLPHVHGIHTHNRRFEHLPVSETFLANLPDSYTTIGVSANVHAGPAFGFDKLFDNFTYVAPQNWYPDGLDLKSLLKECDKSGIDLYKEWFKAAVRHKHPIKSLANGGISKLNTLADRFPIPRPIDDGTKRAINRSKRYLEEEISEPFFLFVNLMEAHPPFQHTRGYDTSIHEVPSSWTSREFDLWEIRRDGAFEANEQNIEYFKQLYRTAIDYLDDIVSDFIDESASLTTLETTCIVTADHGEDLGGTQSTPRFGHTGSLSEGLLHVPLDLYNTPEGYPDTVTDYTSLLDLGDLITGLARNEIVDVTRTSIPAELIGSLRQDQEWPLDESEFEYWNRMIRCAYRDGMKVEWDSLGNQVEYAIDPDRPSHQTKVGEVDEIPQSANNHFGEDIKSYKQRALQQEGNLDEAVDEATLDRLEELGYL